MWARAGARLRPRAAAPAVFGAALAQKATGPVQHRRHEGRGRAEEVAVWPRFGVSCDSPTSCSVIPGQVRHLASRPLPVPQIGNSAVEGLTSASCVSASPAAVPEVGSRLGIDSDDRPNESRDVAGTAKQDQLSPAKSKFEQSSAFSQVALWLPFWRELALPLASVAFAVTQLDWLLAEVLPRGSRSASAAGLFLCVLDLARGMLQDRPCPCNEVSLESGSSVLELGAQRSQVPLTWTCASMRGWRTDMEDTHVATLVQHAGRDLGLFAVFDGHGGWQVSAIAQALLPRVFLEKLDEGAAEGESASWSSQAAAEAVMTRTVEELDSVLLRGPVGVGQLLNLSWLHPFRGVGSTSCIAVVDPVQGRVVVANAGDSRAILCRGGLAVALSTDHKPESDDEHKRIRRAGGSVVRSGPCYRVDGGLNLSRALGDFGYKANSSLPSSEQKIIATPDIVVHSWEPSHADEFLIVACDGLFERMTRQQVVDHVRAGLSEKRTSQDVLKGLLHECCGRSPREPGQDNETAILVQWS
ncbi:unnamed protein product [Polarella glacialis]|uniref:PPM-type phosphatase domain-containing protein n=1 Tax=Polarella glacialis TaxID=89957 RepID=A0A813GFN1_POLGL|nr:unnamed protein product [Polarella glacialis]CAE8720146.1 unnamed protein product [Polarella glacialis]